MTLYVAPAFNRSASGTLMLSFLQEQMEARPTDRHVLLVCNRSVDRCYFNIGAEPYACANCLLSLQNGLDELHGVYELMSIEDIIKRNWRIQEAPVSEEISPVTTLLPDLLEEAVVSTYISATRDKQLSNYYSHPYRTYTLERCKLFYQGLVAFLQEQQVERVFNFNGRWDYLRMVMFASQTTGTEFYNLELCRPGGYIEIYKGVLPHDMYARWQNIANSWSASQMSEDEKIAIGVTYFQKKRDGKTVTDKSYVQYQQKGQLPALPSGHRIISIFNSSDDEFSALGELYKNPYFKDQLDGVQYLFALLSQLPNTTMVLRIHPNLKGVQEEYATKLYELQNRDPNFIVLKPEDTVDSYALLDRSDLIITFGSSIGVEAAFWRKPCVLLGKSVFYHPNLYYEPSSREDILRLLSMQIKPKGYLEAVKLGFHYSAGGVHTKYFTQEKAFAKPMFKGRFISRRKPWQRALVAVLHKLPWLSPLVNTLRLRTTLQHAT